MGKLSNQHELVIKLIKSQFPYYRLETEYHVGSKLFLDIYMPEISIGVEVNGVQHYKFVPHFHGDEIGFEEYKMRDRKKRRLCAELGIGLYTIAYNEEFNINNFTKFVIEHLEKF